MPTCVAITSLTDNIDTNYKYFVYVLTVGVDEENIKRLNELNSVCENVTVILKNADNEFSEVKNLHLGDREKYLSASTASLLKFKLGELFPDLEKLLFLDGDIIITDNLVSLFFTDLGDKCLGAVRDLPQVLYDKQLIGKEISGKDYFNSGVMLLNLAKFRNENYAEKLINTKKQLTDGVLMDQDVFNIVFKGKILALEPKYNVCYLNYIRSADKYNLSDLNKLYGTNYAEISELGGTASVIHFSSKTKPWLCFDVSFADEWVRYYFKSPFKNIPLGRTFHLTEVVKKQELEEKASLFSSEQIDYENTIPIVFCFDQAYMRIASATLASIADHADDNKIYDIYILHDKGLWTTLTYMFVDVVKNKPNFKVTFIDVRNMVNTDAFYNRAHYRESVF
jgi:lipopolysaccharide biosynthesis glycosyltransferase